MRASFINRLMQGTAMLVLGCALAIPARAENYSDLWGTPAEPGWGISIADHETSLYAVWLTFREDGNPTWMVMPGGTLSADRRHFTADIYATSAPPDEDGLFDPLRVRAKRVGTASFDFAPEGLAAGSARFTYEVGAVQGRKVISRQAFGDAPAQWGNDFTDLWGNPEEPGQGVSVTQRGDTVFGVAYTYDMNGDPTFHVMPNGRFSDATSVTGRIYKPRGPWFGDATFNPAEVTVEDIGRGGLAVRERARMYYASSIDGAYNIMYLEPMAFGRAPDAIAK
jgi:hypothetical protein